ncbi:MAG: transporter substrate-binding domain-containing protein [Arcobacteraceae bacterium]
MFKVILLFFLLTNLLQATPIYTQQELEYIKTHQDGFTIGITKDYYPFSYYENDAFHGYSIDLLKLIEQKSGLIFHYKLNSWSKNLKQFKNKKIDLINTISYSDKRKEFVNFSQAYFYISNVMFTQKNNFNDYKNIESLRGKKVGITKDIYYFDAVKNLKLFDLVVFENSREKMKALAFGKIDLILNNLISGQKYIKAAGYSNIKVLDEIDSNIVAKEDLRIGVQKENQLLLSIIDKTLSNITRKEKNELDNRWFGVTNTESSLKITLTEEENSYLKKKQKIIMCVDPDWLPLEKIEDGKHIGLISDYIKLFEKKLDTPIILNPTKTWEESLNAIKTNKCDILSAAENTPNRSQYLNFTTPYIETPLVIATKIGIPFINDLQQVLNKKFSVVKGYSLIEKLNKKYKNIQLIEVDSIEEGLKKVQNEEVFGYIDNSAVINNAIVKRYIGSLVISGQVESKYTLSVATRKDEKLLNTIFEKAVNSIKYETKQELNQKWIKVNYSIQTDYKLIYKIIFVSIILLLLSFYWNRKLNKLKIKAEEATKAKSSFIANMSHEIRTPMNAIVGMTHLIQESNLNERQAKYINNIKQASDNLLYIINDILDFSKIEAGKLRIEKHSFDMREIILNIKNIADVKIADKKIAFIVHSYLEKNHFVGDNFRLTQVLINLVGNAIKFTPQGTVELFIKPLNKNEVKFIIKDTGIGISKTKQEKLFLPFRQADESTTREYGGTGLGLTISKNLVELMGGELEINSEENMGSEFIFTITLPPAEDINNISFKYKDDIDLKEEIKTLANTNILLVEDNEINREIIHALLENSGIAIDNVYDGQMAIDIFYKNPNKYDLILMDIQMPVKSGIEATKIIRKTNTKIPIIALSANAMKEDMIKTTQSGMNEHLNKPIDVNKLYITLLTYIKPKNSIVKKDLNSIPSFKHIDIGIGLKYMNNNKKLYVSVLKKFCEKYHDISIDSIETDKLLFTVNSIKSLSATIGATELYKISEMLEQETNEEITMLFFSTLKTITTELKDKL